MNISTWLSHLGLYNVIVEVNGQYWRINSTTGITAADPSDFAAYPFWDAPDWLITAIHEMSISG